MVLFALAFAALTTAARADDPVGAIADLAGSATATDAAGVTRDLAAGAPVRLGDKIATKDGARLTIRFADGSTVGQGESAELVITKYVYDPDAKANNAAAFRVMRGVFRFITDQITKLNPEQFEVESNYGTIGIRGCDLGFDIGQDRDDVFVIGLAGPENILIRLREDEAGKRPGAPAEVLVREAGIAVGLSPRDGLTQWRFDPDDLRRLIDLTVPRVRPPEEAADEPEGTPPPDVVVQNEPDVPADQIDSIVVDTAFDQQQEGDVPPLETEEGEPVTEPTDGEAPPQDSPDFNPPPPDDGGGPQPTPNANPVYTRSGSPFRAASGSGQDWSWGIWGQKFVKTDADGNETDLTKYIIRTAGRTLDPAVYDAIAAGNIRYTLNGVGPAGAFITQGLESSVVAGDASFSIDVGGVAQPTWQGSFNMDNTAGDSLAFDLNGTIEAGGAVQSPTPSSYTLNAFGQTWGTPVESQVEGSLVGTGTMPDPISGILVRFNFGHGAGGPEVIGAGGADLH
jgi:hypothetical protein